MSRHKRVHRRRESDAYSSDDNVDDDDDNGNNTGRESEEVRHARLAALYDEFKDYIVRTVRRESGNATLDVVDFSSMSEPLPTHMALRLEGVQTANAALYTSVAAFCEDTWLEGNESVNGEHVYTAYLPHAKPAPKMMQQLQQQQQRRGTKPHATVHTTRNTRPPSPYMLTLLLVVLMALFMACVLFTDVSQWYYMIGRRER